MKFLLPAACLLVGVAAGFGIARLTADGDAVVEAAVPSEWVARIGTHYVTAAMLQDEMRRRGREQPGQYRDDAQKRALLDDMLLQQALVDAARSSGLDRQPETQRSIEHLLTSQYLRDTLRRNQNTVQVAPEAVRAHYDANAQDYATPPRRRIAMLRIGVPAGADEAAWAQAEARAKEALDRARALGDATAHFGPVAREYSDDQASRYRGGVIGWLTDGRAADYRHDPALLDAAFALEQDGTFSDVVRGKDAVYVARLIERQQARGREFEQLRSGIEQQLAQEQLARIERDFRDGLLAGADIEVRDAALSAIAPPGPPAGDSTPTPPAMPGAQEAAP